MSSLWTHRGVPTPAVRSDKAISTTPPPASTCTEGASPAPSQAQSTPKTTSSKPSSEISGALSTRAAATAIKQGMASCTTPSSASSDTSRAEAASGSASGSITAADSSAPRSTAASMYGGSSRPRKCCSSVQLTAAATGTPSATSTPSSCVGSPALTSWPYIQAMPAPASAMAAQVRCGRRWPSTNLAPRAVSNGPIDIVTSTLATVVSVSASMKAVYITAQHRPESHSARRPARKVCHKGPGPRNQDSSTTRASALKPLRQKVTSKPRAASRWRDTTPAMLHMSAAATIIETALR